MAAAPPFKVYDSANNYQAAAKTLDLAKAAAAHLGPGATVRTGHRTRHTIHTIPESLPSYSSQMVPANTCTHCGATPLDWGQRGDGEAQQDPETGLPYCGTKCLERAAIHDAAETAQGRAVASNDIAFKTLARALHIIADAHTPTPDLSAFREQI